MTRQQQEKKDQVAAAGVHTGERPLPFQEYLKKSLMRKIFFYQSAYHTPDFSPHNLDVYTSKHTHVAGGVLHEDQRAAPQRDESFLLTRWWAQPQQQPVFLFVLKGFTSCSSFLAVPPPCVASVRVHFGYFRDPSPSKGAGRRTTPMVLWVSTRNSPFGMVE